MRSDISMGINKMNKIVIQKCEINWITRYHMDLMGDVFEYQGRIFRLVKQEREEFVRELFSSGILSSLFRERLLINSWITDEIQIVGLENAIIIEHEAIKHKSNVYEWTYEMLLAARSTVARLNVYLLNYGYELMDPHVGNIMFMGCKPVYVDIGSIARMEECKMVGYSVFNNHWINLLKVYEKRDTCGAINQNLLYFGGGVSDRDRAKLIKGEFIRAYRFRQLYMTVIARLYGFEEVSKRKIINRGTAILQTIFQIDDEKKKKRKRKLYKKYVTYVHKELQSERGVWSDYQNFAVLSTTVVAGDRFGYYIQLMQKLREDYAISDVLEVGANSGALSQLLVERNIVDFASATDYDIAAVSKGFVRCKEIQRINERILFSVMDLLQEKELGRRACERYKSDVVMALALSHHLILTQKIKLSVLVTILSNYTKRFLIIEFMPLGLWSGANPNPDVQEWYTLDWFVEGLREKFQIVKVENIETNRVCILASKL